VTNSDDTHDGNKSVGYGKPPKRTQFVMGQSGNPKGRPKGSQSFATILAKMGRERVKVIENGRTRYITKFEATMLQLVNKAASGDLHAARELRTWCTSIADRAEGSARGIAFNEDKDPLQELIDSMSEVSARLGRPEGQIERVKEER
jgi:Family of unknown function (DUF5681)